MNNSTACPQCGREAINGGLPCKCNHTFDPTWNLPVKHEQQEKLDKIIALLEQIKERK